MEMIGMSTVELAVFGVTALLIVVVAAVARRGQPSARRVKHGQE